MEAPLGVRRLAIAAGVLWLSVPLLAQSRVPMVDYDRQVHPVLAARCGACHSQLKREGGLSLATYADTLDGGRSGATIRPGDSASSLLLQRITGETQPRMPIGGDPLSEAETALVRAWIDQGARRTPTSEPAQPKWEPPLELTAPAVPAVTWSDWNGPLDRFVAAYLAEEGVAEPAPVSDARFARRVYLDIQGLLPEPGELRAFLEDRAPDKREKLVTRLLTDKKKYAEHWISFWNDLLRNDEGVNYYSETAARKTITPWLLGALESNLPYDRFVGKLLNPAEPGDPDGFLVGVNWRGTVSASQIPAMQAAQNSAQIFLGINLKCNACHDSFINKWKLKQAYALASYFSEEPKLQLYRCDVAQQEFAGPGFLFPELDRQPASASQADRRAAAAAIFTDPRNGRLPRTLVNRVWRQLMGRGIVGNPDEMDEKPWSAEVLDWLAGDFAAHGYDVQRLIATIVRSRTYQMPAVPRAGEQPRRYVFRGPEVRRLSAEQFADAVGAITGDWHVFQPADLTQPGVFTREWHVKASPLTRALGRPIRDQVYSTRDTQATTLQALELVNGEALSNWLWRGARKMLGELPPEPAAVFDQPFRRREGPTPFDIDIRGAKKLWLLVQDVDSYAPEKVEAVWARAELVSPDGAVTPLASLEPAEAGGLREGSGPVVIEGAPGGGVRVKTPSRVVYDLGGKAYSRLRGIVGLENREITNDIMPNIRFFVFTGEPNPERLTPVRSETPLPPGPVLRTVEEAVDRVFRHALGRAPSPEERREAEAALRDPARPGKPSAEGLADLLWAVMMKPEFQLIY